MTEPPNLNSAMAIKLYQESLTLVYTVFAPSSPAPSMAGPTLSQIKGGDFL